MLGRIADLDWLARAEFIDEVILALPGRPRRTREAAEVAFRNHLDIRAVPDLPPGPWPDARRRFTSEKFRWSRCIASHVPSAALFLKRLIDVAGAALRARAGQPCHGDRGLADPAGFAGAGYLLGAERTGAKGRRFRCYKFRSMVTNAEHLKEELRAQNQRQGPIFKIDDDPRITRIGRFIRRYSLDELPQLWNVLRGEMSLVGPRPHPVDEVNHYELQHYRRLDVKPGITGLWQITARDCPSFDLNMHLDLTYIENLDVCDWICAFLRARSACCFRRKEPDSGHEQPALALTRDSDDNLLWHAAGCCSSACTSGWLFRRSFIVAAMTVFLFRPPDLFSFYADRIAFGILVFFVALRTMALRDKIPFFAGTQLAHARADGAGCSPRARGNHSTRKSGALSPASLLFRSRCFTLRCWCSAGASQRRHFELFVGSRARLSGIHCHRLSCGRPLAHLSAIHS